MKTIYQSPKNSQIWHNGKKASLEKGRSCPSSLSKIKWCSSYERTCLRWWRGRRGRASRRSCRSLWLTTSFKQPTSPEWSSPSLAASLPSKWPSVWPTSVAATSEPKWATPSGLTIRVVMPEWTGIVARHTKLLASSMLLMVFWYESACMILISLDIR